MDDRREEDDEPDEPDDAERRERGEHPLVGDTAPLDDGANERETEDGPENGQSADHRATLVDALVGHVERWAAVHRVVLVAHRFVVRGGNTFSVDPEYSRGERVTARVKVRPRARRTEAEDV